MTELDRFDRQMTAAVRRFADGARTEVDAVAVATRAARGRRAGAWGWFGSTVPVPVALLLILGLLLLGVASLAAGGRWPLPVLIDRPAPMPTGAATAAPTPAPTAQQVGGTHVTGTETVSVQAPGATTVIGDVTQLRGGIESVTTVADDVRASGTGTFAYSADFVGSVGTEWGTFHLESTGGAWEGSCSGSTWEGGAATVGTCWLTGSGAFAGFTYFRSYSWSPGEAWVQGVIYPGSPGGT